MLTFSGKVDSYITSPPGVLPPLKQKAFLDSMTKDIFLTPTGKLSAADVSETIPRLMSAWSSRPIVLPKKTTRRRARVSSSLLPTTRAKSLECPLSLDDGPTAVECATTTEKLLKRLIDEQYAMQFSQGTNPMLTTEIYNSVLASWVRVCEPKVAEDSSIAIAAATRATTIIIQMQELYEQDTELNKYIQPDESTYRIALSAWVAAAEMALEENSEQAYHATSHAQSVVEWMMDLYLRNVDGQNDQLKSVILDQNVYHTILYLWVQCTSVEFMSLKKTEKARAN